VYKVSALGQFFALSARSLKVLLRDRLAILFVLAAPLLAAGLDLVVASRNMYDAVSGSSERVMLSSAVLVFLVMLFAGFSWTPEIRKEAAIIRHERQTSLKLVPYVLAKVWIVALFALYQALVWSGIHFFIANVPGGITAWLTFFITLASVALIGGLLGLLASALTRSGAGAAALVFIIVLPQLLFSGGLRQLADPEVPALNWINPSRMAFEALITAGGHGQDLFLDGCLNQPEEQRRALTASEKRQQCKCLGDNLFSQCRFPGLGSIDTPELVQVETGQSGDQFLRQPPQPLYSPGQSLEEYSAEVNQYTEEVENYWLAQNKAIEDQTRNQATREIAVQRAESLIKNEYDRYRDIFYVFLPGRWAALWISATALTILFAGVLKRKEAPG
jgi:hypothetical protein